MDAKRFLRLKEEAELLKSQEAKLQGSLEHLLASLKSDYGAADAAAAEKLLKKLDAEAARLEARYEESLAEYEGKWASRLTGSD